MMEKLVISLAAICLTFACLIYLVGNWVGSDQDNDELYSE